MPRVLGVSVVWGGGEWSLVQVVVPGLGSTEGDFLVESAESLHLHLCLGETLLHLQVRLLEVHDVVGSYKERVRIVGARANSKHKPRSKRETLLLFWLETGRTSFSLAYPSRSSSRRRCSASMRCLRVASFLVLARCSARETPIIGSSSSEIERPRLRRLEVLVGEGVGLYLTEPRLAKL